MSLSNRGIKEDKPYNLLTCLIVAKSAARRLFEPAAYHLLSSIQNLYSLNNVTKFPPP
jgi:hypothetical protein